MKKYTVCLYDGSVVNIEHIVATRIVEANNFNDIEFLTPFYDVVEKTNDYTIYRNRITKKDFYVYYYRIILLSEEVHTYDFGSHSRFVAIFEGEHKKQTLPRILTLARYNTKA